MCPGPVPWPVHLRILLTGRGHKPCGPDFCLYTVCRYGVNFLSNGKDVVEGE